MEPVSVVVTCFNLKTYIAQAIKSVMDQDYEGQIQLIVVDDRSTDGSPEIVGEIAGVQLVRQAENGGVMLAMLSGIQHASHDVILFLDGDDVWHPEKVSRVMRRFAEGAAFVTHDLWYMDGQGIEKASNTRTSAVLSAMSPQALDGAIREGVLAHADYVWLGSAFGVRKSRVQLDEFSDFCRAFPTVKNCYQDWPLAVWVATAPDEKMSYVDDKLFGYRIHGENYSGAAQTVSKRVRNYRKSYETMRLIEKIMEHRKASANYVLNTERIRKSYQIEMDSLAGSRVFAMKSLTRNAGDVMRRRGGISSILKALFFVVAGPQNGVEILELLKRIRQKIQIPCGMPHST